MRIKYVSMLFEHRYIDDEDFDFKSANFPFLEGNVFNIKVDMKTGQIADWDENCKAFNLYAKVTDSGIYTFLDPKDNECFQIYQDYVPHGVIPGEWGDYIHLKVNDDGIITNWPVKTPISAMQEIIKDQKEQGY